MNTGEKAIGVAVIGWFLFVVSLWIGSISASLYGVYLVFSASIVMGICFLFAPFLFPLTALLSVFADVSLPQKVLEFLK